MDQHRIELIRGSSSQVPWQSASLIGNFHIHLFNIDSSVQTVYAQSRFNPVREMLGFFGVAAEMLIDPDSLNNLLNQIGRRHVGYGALRSHYGAIGEALVMTLEGALGATFTPETREAWLEFYALLSQRMIAAEFRDEEVRIETPERATLELEDLFEDSGPQSAHIPLL